MSRTVESGWGKGESPKEPSADSSSLAAETAHRGEARRRCTVLVAQASKRRWRAVRSAVLVLVFSADPSRASMHPAIWNIEIVESSPGMTSFAVRGVHSPPPTTSLEAQPLERTPSRLGLTSPYI